MEIAYLSFESRWIRPAMVSEEKVNKDYVVQGLSYDEA
jgi:hypothetical protein